MKTYIFVSATFTKSETASDMYFKLCNSSRVPLSIGFKATSSWIYNRIYTHERILNECDTLFTGAQDLSISAQTFYRAARAITPSAEIKEISRRSRDI